MAPKSSQKSSVAVQKAEKSKTTSQITTLKLQPSTANTKRINPLTAFVNLSQERPSSTPSSTKAKGKQKAKQVEKQPSPNLEENGQLWVDLYEPQSEGELAVHVRKVENVRNWFREALEGGPSGKLRKYRRILVLTGPAGTAKSSTIRILSKELNFETLEWRNSMGYLYQDSLSTSRAPDDTMFTKFQLFLERASKCQSVFTSSTTISGNGSSPLSPPPRSTPTSSSNHRIILLEELPNILHSNTRSQFHDVIRSLLETNDPSPVPIVIVLSDSGIRGEAGDERLASGSWGRDQDGAVDIRTLLPKDVLQGPYVHEIRFNPIAPTLLKKALQALLNRHFGSKSPITGQMLDVVVDSANGDIRSAIMALQFASIRLKKNPKGGGPQVLVESITRREQSLVLFHLLGKVFYNKRKGDPPPPSALAKDIKKDQELDRRLEDPPELPPHLSEHNRKASRVDVNTIYADSPIDSSLFSLYIHQNYTQFCTNVDECDGIADWLSWADSSGGEAWHQINPYRFHLMALGTLHSLPTPVPRLSQKVYKPDFFENLNKEKEAREGVRDVRSWIIEQGSDSGWDLSAWTPKAIATELGGILRAQDVPSSKTLSPTQRIPLSHRTFSSLKFIHPRTEIRTLGREQLSEGDDGELYSDGATVLEEQQDMELWQGGKDEDMFSKAEVEWWKESDDIVDS
ncbi:hypothetical protein GYMLUDRAFT_40178 [Collybiopsis luxurians FD-317 M1]|uniref:Checkpoint protein RAD24-like helical bundle domain-containing protein n=1 Tax=Collybiopsis luxurians FD-317 M1 TaxID=944289 RepID=A0A0D0BIN4_9AGAR|nr:hypothetical protein GYMLUDRAFT_40178 [Collybiopsis luxurians FD-317 M1]